MNLLTALTRSSVRRARRLDHDAVRELWRFRLGMIDLKDRVPPEADFTAFTQDFNHDGLVWTVRDGAGSVVVMMMLSAERVHLQDRHLALLIPEYGFVAPEVRSSPIVPVAMLTMAILGLLQLGTTQAWFVGGAYPSSFISWTRSLSSLWTVHSPELTDADRDLLHAVGNRLAGERYRRSDGTIELRTLPRPTPGPRSARGRELFSHYQACNPEWRQGRALLFAHPTRLGALPAVTWRAVTRSRNRVATAALTAPRPSRQVEGA